MICYPRTSNDAVRYMSMSVYMHRDGALTHGVGKQS